MDILAQLNKHDEEMVELYSADRKYLLGAIHKDSFLMEDADIYTALSVEEAVVLRIELAGPPKEEV